MSKLTKAEFNKLKREWYGKLKESGFEDIEEKVPNPIWLRDCDTASYPFRCMAPHKRKDRAEYFNVLTAIVNNPATEFRNATDKYILNCYIDGYEIAAIIRSLAHIGIFRDRKTIRILIRRYEMKWHLRKYTRKQLNLKD